MTSVENKYKKMSKETAQESKDLIKHHLRGDRLSTESILNARLLYPECL